MVFTFRPEMTSLATSGQCLNGLTLSHVQVEISGYFETVGSFVKGDLSTLFAAMHTIGHFAP